MKLKVSILLTILVFVSTTAFGQEKPVKTTTVPNQPADVKKLEVKVPDVKAEVKPSAAVKLPTVAEILAKYVKAIGGKEANEKIKSRMMKGTIELAPVGVKGTFETYSAAPSKSILRMNLSGVGEFVEGFDGTTAWAVNPVQGSRDKTGDELAQNKLTYNFYRETNLDKLYPKMEVKGIEKVGASDAYVVVGTVENLPPDTFYFDVQSGLLVRQDRTSITPEGKTPMQTFYEDYRDVDGAKVSFKSRAVLPQFEVISVVTEIKNNVPVDDAKFAKPKE